MKYLLSVSAIALSLGIASPARAGGVPVIDASAITQAVAILSQLGRTHGIEVEQLTTGLKQLQEAITTVERLQTQIEQLDREFAAITGNRGMAQLLNGEAFRSARRIAGGIESINASLHDLAGSLPDSDPLKGRIEDIRTTFAIPKAEELFDVSRAPAKVAAHDLANAATVTALVMAEDGFGRAETSIARVEDILAEVDRAPDIKAALDLNTRMMAELAFMLADGQRVAAAGLQMESALANETLRDRETGKQRLSFIGTTE